MCPKTMFGDTSCGRQSQVWAYRAPHPESAHTSIVCLQAKKVLWDIRVCLFDFIFVA